MCCLWVLHVRVVCGCCMCVLCVGVACGCCVWVLHVRVVGVHREGVFIHVLVTTYPPVFPLVCPPVFPLGYPFPTQNVINQYTNTAKDPRLSFFGNVHVGRDVSVDELRGLYSAV